MTAKFASLQIAVDYIKPDVIIECESKINENILTSESGDFNCPSIFIYFLLLFINSSFKSAYSHSVDQGAVQLKIYICKRNNIILIN